MATECVRRELTRLRDSGREKGVLDRAAVHAAALSHPRLWDLAADEFLQYQSRSRLASWYGQQDHSDRNERRDTGNPNRQDEWTKIGVEVNDGLPSE